MIANLLYRVALLLSLANHDVDHSHDHEENVTAIRSKVAIVSY